MLASYPIAASQENWLHETLVYLVQIAHQRIGSGRPITKSKACWRGIIPSSLSNEQQLSLTLSTGVRDRLYDYSEEVKILTIQDRVRILEVLDNQNQIYQLLRNQLYPLSIKQDYPGVHKKAKDLFVFAYEKLTDFGVRNRQYGIVFNSLSSKFCPFCGIERFMNPEETAQDQDHYIPKSEYPFSAVNMRNLAPMCRCCNRDYKKDKNLLLDSQGNLRPAFDPYDCQPVVVSLIDSLLDTETSPPKPEWNINFIPETPEIEAWDDVFSIRERYKRDSLDQYFDKWLRGFFNNCSRKRQRREIPPNMDFNGVRNVLAYYHEDKVEDPSIGVGFLEPYVFEFLLAKYDAGEERVINLIRNAVLGNDLDEAL